MAKAHTNPKLDDAVRERRKEAGIWLRSLREAAGLSQRELAKATGIEHYPFIAQIEHGVGRVPAERFKIWANALGAEPRSFTIRLMGYYDRALYDLLFTQDQIKPSVRAAVLSDAPPADDDLVKVEWLPVKR